MCVLDMKSSEHLRNVSNGLMNIQIDKAAQR